MSSLNAKSIFGRAQQALTQIRASQRRESAKGINLTFPHGRRASR
jgi:hypothetical protein